VPPRADLRLALISDLNAGYGSTSYTAEVDRAIALIPSLRPDLVLCAGDMVAGQKTSLTTTQLTAMWAAFERRILSPLRRAGLPFAPTVGNHDALASRAGGSYLFECERQEAARFWRRRQSSRWPLLRGRQRLSVLLFHSAGRPVPAGLGRLLGAGAVLAGAEALRQLMERHDVAAYISGHQHAYYPARLGQLDLFNLGATGSGPRPLLQGGCRPLPDPHRARPRLEHRAHHRHHHQPANDATGGT
jgi:hypothetical protein